MAMLQLDAPPNTLNASNGLTARMPFATKTSCCFSANSMPPSAEPV